MPLKACPAVNDITDVERIRPEIGRVAGQNTQEGSKENEAWQAPDSFDSRLSDLLYACRVRSAGQTQQAASAELRRSCATG